MERPATIRDLGFKTLNLVHRSVLRISGRRIGSSAFGMAVVELRSIGRRTGLERSTVLTAPVVDGDRIVLVASKGGDERDPDWYLNLVATPEASVIIHGDRRLVVARTASLAEKAELWPRVVAAYRGYAGYERRSSRDIPVVILEPA